MKKDTFLILLNVLTFICSGQSVLNIQFEDSDFVNNVFMDTTPNHKNIWQIGKPQKTVFDNAYSPTHAIVTDTFNYYPINDTSWFIVKKWKTNPSTESITFFYEMNSDSIKDFGIVEYSKDTGKTWIKIQSPLQSLTGNTNGWREFYYIVPYDPNEPHQSVLYEYKFTFISDNIQTNKEGWMIDDLSFIDIFDGIEAIQDNNLISIYPNPTSDYLSIYRLGNSSVKQHTIQIFNYTGQLIYENKNLKDDKIDIRLFKNGIYLLRYSEDEEKYALKKFVIEH